MNWQQLLWNIVAAAVTGAAGAGAILPAGAANYWKLIAAGAVTGVTTNVAGLFQRQPHNP